MRERYKLQFFHITQDEVVLDGNDVVVAKENHTLLLQVPVIHPIERKTII